MQRHISSWFCRARAGGESASKFAEKHTKRELMAILNRSTCLRPIMSSRTSRTTSTSAPRHWVELDHPQRASVNVGMPIKPFRFACVHRACAMLASTLTRFQGSPRLRQTKIRLRRAGASLPPKKRRSNENSSYRQQDFGKAVLEPFLPRDEVAGVFCAQKKKAPKQIAEGRRAGEASGYQFPSLRNKDAHDALRALNAISASWLRIAVRAAGVVKIRRKAMIQYHPSLLRNIAGRARSTGRSYARHQTGLSIFRRPTAGRRPYLQKETRSARMTRSAASISIACSQWGCGDARNATVMAGSTAKGSGRSPRELRRLVPPRGEINWASHVDFIITHTGAIRRRAHGPR